MLGHPSFTYLKILFPLLFKKEKINKNPSDFQYETCELAKHHQKLRPQRSSKISIKWFKHNFKPKWASQKPTMERNTPQIYYSPTSRKMELSINHHVLTHLQHNGVTKRKNHHLQVVRTLTFQMGVAKQY